MKLFYTLSYTEQYTFWLAESIYFNVLAKEERGSVHVNMVERFYIVN